MGVRHHLSKVAAGASTWSLVCGLALFGVLTGGLLAPGLAAADPMPLWSDPITTTDWGAYGAGGREAMYVNALQMGRLDTERVIGPDGAVEYQAETGNTTITPPALAVDGSGYVLRGGGAAGVIDAIDTAGKVRWSYGVPTEDTARALLAGNDGAAYVAMSNSAGGEVVRLSPVDGSVTFDTPLPYGVPLYGYTANGFLFAEPSGVAAISGSHVLFLSQQGQITADVPAFPSGSATVFTSNTAGDVFVGSEVNLTNGLSVSKVDPSGQLDWTTQTPATGEELGSMALAALPDGGVAYEVAGQSVGVLNADGTTRWNTKNPLGYGAMLSDSSDHIDFERVVSNQSCSDAVANCDGFAVDQLRASDGQVQHSVSSVSSEDPSRFWFCGGFSLGPGLFYVLDRLAPADGEICSGGLTQPQLQAFALSGTTGPYPSPPATTIPLTTETTGGGGGTGPGAPGDGGLGNPPPSGVPIVLVPGFDAPTNTVRAADPSCNAGGEWAYLCSRLRYLGHPVYVVGASRGGVGRKPGEHIVLDSLGDLDANAIALRSFLKGTVHTPALLVGHSMGGLIARIAVSRYGASAAGLYTLGTPHDGSFIADIATGVNDACLTANLTMCAFRNILARWYPLSATAVHEMTWLARATDRLPGPGIPVWTLAGTKIDSGTFPNYLFPNDLVVGETSAHGQTANLGHQKSEPNLLLYHFDPTSMGLVSAGLPPADSELDSPLVGDLLSSAAKALTRGLHTSRVQASAVSSRHAVTAANGPETTSYSVRLFVAHAILTHRRVSVGAFAVANQFFRAFCGKTALSTIALPGGLSALDAADTTCPHLTAIPPLHGSLMVTSNPAALRASVTVRGDHMTVSLRAAQAVSLATLRLGKRTIRLHRDSSRRWHLTFTAQSRVPGVLISRCNNQTYAVSVPFD